LEDSRNAEIMIIALKKSFFRRPAIFFCLSLQKQTL